MAYSGRRLKTDPFTDLLFNVLLAFTLLMFLAIIFMNPIPKTGVINPKAKYKVVIEGHADERGTEKYNMKLSKRRANSVYKLSLIHI